MEPAGGKALIAFLLAFAAAAQEPLPAAPGAGPWEAMLALEQARFDRAGRAPIGLIAAAAGEIGAGTAGLVLLDDPTAGAIAVAGGIVHAAMAAFSIESNHRRKKAFYAKIDALDPGRPGAAAALAESLRRSSDSEARWHTFVLGGHLALPAAGALSEGLDCLELFGAAGCEIEPVIALGVVGLVGGVHSATRWRAASRTSSDFSLVHQEIPTVLSGQ